MNQSCFKSANLWRFLRKFNLEFLVLLLAFPLTLFAQDLKEARKVIDTLCSPYFEGRGYVEMGNNRAGIYLRSKIKEMGLMPFEKDSSYKDRFAINVNIFDGDLILYLGAKEFIIGKDFIPAADCGVSDLETLKVVYFKNEKSLTTKKVKGKALVIHEDSLKNNKGLKNRLLVLQPAAFIVLKKGKLIGDIEDHQLPFPSLEVKEKVWLYGTKKLTIKADAFVLNDYPCANIMGYAKGIFSDSVVIISAHYDHLGKFGRVAYCPGANDNASGVAMLLDLAKYYVANPPHYDILFIAFDAEEAGLKGSKHFVETYPEIIKKTAFEINLDLMANGQDGMMVVNGSVFPHYYKLLDSINTANHYLKEIKQRGKAANSDHYWFSEYGVKSFFFYLLGDYPYYHDIYDTPEKPTYAGYEGCFRLIRDFIKELN